MSQPNLEVDLNLSLPQEIKHEVDGQLLYSFTPDNFRLVLKIYTSYTYLSKENVSLHKDIEQLEKDIELLHGAVLSCSYTLKEVNRDREFIYKLRESDIKKMEADAKKNKLKIILWSGGSAIVAAAIGIIVGVFAI